MARPKYVVIAINPALVGCAQTTISRLTMDYISKVDDTIDATVYAHSHGSFISSPPKYKISHQSRGRPENCPRVLFVWCLAVDVPASSAGEIGSDVLVRSFISLE